MGVVDRVDIEPCVFPWMDGAVGTQQPLSHMFGQFVAKPTDILRVFIYICAFVFRSQLPTNILIFRACM